MLEQPIYQLTKRTEIRDVIDRNGWATLVTARPEQDLVVSHLPVILDPESDEVVILGHLGRADGDLHALGKFDVVLVFQGPHGYISPSFYRSGPYVPTWNFVVVHLHGRPQILADEQTYAVLSATVDHFEADRASPWQLGSVDEYAHSIAPNTIGFRLDPIRTVAKVKLSQDKPAVVVDRVIDALETDPHHHNVSLAQAMRHHVLGE